MSKNVAHSQKNRLSGKPSKRIKRSLCLTMGLAQTLAMAQQAALANAWQNQSTTLPQAFANAAITHAQGAAMGSPVQTHNAWQHQAQTFQPNVADAHAQSINMATTAGRFAGITRPMAQGYNFAPQNNARDFNLNSANPAFYASTLGNFQSLTIQIGSRQEVINLTSKLTAGELVAAQQVLNGGTQTLKLNANGTASSGTFTLDKTLLATLDSGGGINSLTIARGVKVIDTLSSLTIGGIFANYGTFYTASETTGKTDIIGADRIINSASGSIASYSGGNGLFAADPSLVASSAITNSGRISSSGILSLSAPQINNIADPASTTLAQISAAKNVNINTENLNNQGLIAATAGNINIAAVNGLSVNNAGGTLRASNGNINLISDKGSVTATAGGDYLSKNLNFSAVNGDADLNAENVTARINADATCVHITTASDQILGDIKASGDPQFVSTTGNVTIDGTMSVSSGADLAFLAAGNIVTTKGAMISTTPSATGNGGNLIMMAGVNVTGDNTSATVSGASATGGIIDLNGGNGGKGAIAQLTTAANTTGNAGYIVLSASAGTAKNSGSIIVPAKVAIDASGAGGGSNGNIAIIAGGTATAAISTGNITGGNVTIANAKPLIATSTFANGTSNKGFATVTAGPATTGGMTVGVVSGATSANLASGQALGTASKPVDVESPSVSVSGPGSGSKANVYLTSKSGQATTLASVIGVSGGTFQYTSTGDITVNTDIGAASTTITTSGAGQITATTNVIYGNVVNLNSGTGSIAADINVVTANVKSSGAVTLTQHGQDLTLGTVANTPSSLIISVQDSKNIIVSKAVTAGSSLSLSAANVLGSSAVKADSITLTAATDIGTTAKPFITAGKNLTLTAGHNVYAAQTGDATVSGGAGSAYVFSLKDTGNLTIANLNSNNDVITATKALTFAGVLRASNGTSPVTSMKATIGSDFTIASTGDFNGKFVGPSFNLDLKVPGNMTVNGLLTITSPDSSLDVTVGNAFTVGTTGNIQSYLTSTSKTFTNSGTVNGFLVNVTATAAGANAIDMKSGSVFGSSGDGGFTTLVNTSGTGGITVEPGAKISTTDLLITSGTIVNNGEIHLGSTSYSGFLQAISRSGSLTYTGAPGSLTSTAYPDIEFTASKNVTIQGSAPGVDPLSSLTQLSSFGVGAEGGTLTLPTNTVKVVTSPDGQGGIINFIVGNINYLNQATSPLVLTADGTNTAPGTPSRQNVQIYLPGTSATGMTIGNGAGNIEIIGMGANSTYVTLSTPGTLKIDMNYLQTVGVNVAEAHTLSLNGNKGIIISGNLATNADVQIITTSKVPFVIGASADTTNGLIAAPGASNGISGGLISFITPGGVTVNSGYQVTSTNAIYTTGNTITNLGTITAPAVVLQPVTGNASFDTSGGIVTAATDFTLSAMSGALTVAGSLPSSGNTLNILSSKGGITFADSANLLQAHAVVIDAKLGVVTFGASGSTVISGTADGSGNGGTITLDAQSIAGGAASFKTTATGTTNSGSIDVELTGTKTLTVGTSGLSITMNTASGTAPSLKLNNGGPINVDTASVSLNKGGGTSADLSINSLKGPLYISSLTALSNQGLHDVTLSSGSTSTFLTGGAKVNTNGTGDTATPTLTASGALTINNAGSIDASKAQLNSADIALTATKGALIFASGQTVAAQADSLGNGGTLTLNAAALTGTNLIFAANPSGGGFSGIINVNISGTKAINVGGPSSNFSVQLLNTGGAVGGALSIINGGALTVDATSLSLGSGYAAGSGPDLTLNAKGNLLVKNTEAINALLKSVVFASSSTSNFVLSGGEIKGNGLSWGNGSKAFSADSIAVSNAKGSVDLTAASGTLTANVISASAPAGSLLFDPSQTFAATQYASTNQGGSLSLTAKTITNASTLTLAATGQTGGSVTLDLTATTPYLVDKSAPIIDVTGTTSNGAISISGAGNVTLKASNNLIFNHGQPGPALAVSAGAILNVDGTGDYMSGYQSLSLSSSSKTAFLLAGAADGKGNGVTGNASPSAINLAITNKGGAVLMGTATDITALQTLTLTALTDLGTSTAPIVIGGNPQISVNTGPTGNAYIVTNGTASAIASGTVGGILNVAAQAINISDTFQLGGSGSNKVTAGAINATFTNSTNVSNGNKMLIGNVGTTTGDLVVSTNAQILQIMGNAQITTANGNIFLNNFSTSPAALPSIKFASGATVHAAGPASNYQTGNVFIYIGAQPNLANGKSYSPGALPYFLTYGFKPNGTFSGNALYFSGTNNPLGSNGTISSADSSDVFTSISFRYLAFNTGTYSPSQIVVAPNVTFIADPPVPVANPYAINANLAAHIAGYSGLATAVAAQTSNPTVSIPTKLKTETPITPPAQSNLAFGNAATLSDNATVNAIRSANSQTMEKPAQTDRKTTHQKLNSGAILLAPDSNTEIETPFGKVKVVAGAVALIVTNDNGLSVYDLHDEKRCAVTVISGEGQHNLSPGKAMFIGGSLKHNFEDINPARSVGYRNVKVIGQTVRGRVFGSEFEIISMLRSLPAVNKQKGIARVLKTAAIMATLSSGGEAFTLRLPPEVTAWAN